MQELAVQNQNDAQDGADAELAVQNQNEAQDGADAGVGCTEPE